MPALMLNTLHFTLQIHVGERAPRNGGQTSNVADILYA